MLRVSLTMMRTYQPLTNSSLSDQGTSVPLLVLRYWVYSCLQHQECELVAGTDGFFSVICLVSPHNRFTYTLQANPSHDRARAEDEGGHAGHNDETVKHLSQVESLSS